MTPATVTSALPSGRGDAVPADHVLDRHPPPDARLKVSLTKIEVGGEWQTVIDWWFDAESGHRLHRHIMHAEQNPEHGVMEFML